MGFDGKYGKVTTQFGDIPDDDTVMSWQQDNKDKVKTPDSERSREWMGDKKYLRPETDSE